MSGEDGRLRVMEVVTGPEAARTLRTTLVRDAESRISDTRVRCMPAVAKRGRTRSVALVTTERPVHERTLARTVRAAARRFDTGAMLEVDVVITIRKGKEAPEFNLPRKRGVSTEVLVTHAFTRVSPGRADADYGTVCRTVG